jgi:FkbM family methyltransferase
MSVKLKYLYRAYRYRFRVDPAEIRFVRQTLQPGQVAVDIGCHKGAYTYWMRRRVGPGGAVYAFEPQPTQVAYLRKAFSAMNYDNVELVPMALSNKSGEMPLYTTAISSHFATLEIRDVFTRGRPSVGAGAGSGDPRTAGEAGSEKRGARSENVDVTTLDEFFSGSRRRPHFLKIDVEGHELSVLEGGRRMLEQDHPTILVECEARHRPDHDVQPVFSLLESLGYVGSFFHDGARWPLSQFDVAVHQRLDADSDELPESYANNFAFEFRK